MHRNCPCLSPVNLRALPIFVLLGVWVSNFVFVPPVSAAEEVKVRHILVRKRAEAGAALDELVNLGVNRENFIRVARKHSMDPVTKGAGGDLGWNTFGKFVKEFSEEAFSLKAGEVSEPVRTEFGWHIIYVEDRRDTRDRPKRDPKQLPVSDVNPTGGAGVPAKEQKADSPATAKTTPAAVNRLPQADAPTIIDGRGLPKVLVETSKGNMTVELFQDDARNTVFNFISLIEKGFYTGAKRSDPMKVLEKQPGYYVRTGSPDNSNIGGPGYRINNETASNTRGHELGTLSMCLEVDSSTGKPLPNSAGSQFFICLGEVSFWNGLYTPFGKVIEGNDVLTKLEEGDTILNMRVLAKRRGQYTPTTQQAK